MKLKKINLAEFEVAKLKVNELLVAKGGCGSTSSSCSSTDCTGTDHDMCGCDQD